MDLEMIQNWTIQWKINFNPDTTKQVQEVIFSSKTKKKLPHPSFVFNNAKVVQSIYQKHLGIILDSKLTFQKHLKMGTIKKIRLLDSSINYKTYYQEPL